MTALMLIIIGGLTPTPVMRASGGTRVSDKRLGATARSERTHCDNGRRCRRPGARVRSDADLHVTVILGKLTRSRESGADEEQSAQGAEHDVCPVGTTRLAAVAVRLVGRKFLIRAPMT